MGEGKKDIRLHDGELNVMEMIWANNNLPAKDIARIVKEYVGWEKNTTYTVIKRLIDKGAVERKDPGFICSALITKSQVQEIETKALLDKMFQGSLSDFISEYLVNQKLTNADIINLQMLLNKYKLV